MRSGGPSPAYPSIRAPTRARKRERPSCSERSGNVASDRGGHALDQLNRQQPLGAARIVKQLRGAQQRAFRKLRPLELHKPRLRGKDILVKRRIDRAGHGVQMGKRPIAQLAYGRHACGSGFPRRAEKLHELRHRLLRGVGAAGKGATRRKAARHGFAQQRAAHRLLKMLLGVKLTGVQACI